jgi:CRP/FNR family transcriptional regulator
VFVVCNGRVKLSASARDGKTLILRIAEAGELVGLPATLSGEPYGVTGEVLEPTQANFIPREAFLNFLRENGVAALKVAQILGQIVHAGYRDIRSLNLPRSSVGKVSKFLLDWSDRYGRRERKSQLKLTLTHEEIGQMVGASRETVTRILSDLRKKQVVQIKGSAVLIRNRSALEQLAGG